MTKEQKEPADFHFDETTPNGQAASKWELPAALLGGVFLTDIIERLPRNPRERYIEKDRLYRQSSDSSASWLLLARQLRWCLPGGTHPGVLGLTPKQRAWVIREHARCIARARRARRPVEE